MDKGTKLRITVHDILCEIYKSNKNLENKKINDTINLYEKRDASFIYNVCLNTMRYSIHCEKIITAYGKKKNRFHELILLKSAITQIVFLEFKEYAVINCTVNIAKKLNIYHGFVNALLKRVAQNKNHLSRTKIGFNELPYWFVKENKNISDRKKEEFLNNIVEEPSIHFVFKKNENLKKFEEKIFRTSNNSGFVCNSVDIEELKSYKEGSWWIQDYSSFFPITYLIKSVINTHKKIKAIDLCAAPGGKSFQLLNNNIVSTLNDKSKNRINILKKNLIRLKFKTKILNKDVLKIDNSQYDLIILDAPCSSVGTIRKNPEIFFKSKAPYLNNLLDLQSKMLTKAASLLKNNGIIIYMVCSFLEKETFSQIDKFLIKNTSFSLLKFELEKNNSHLIKNGCFYTLPFKYSKYNSDGYFAAMLKKAI